MLKILEFMTLEFITYEYNVHLLKNIHEKNESLVNKSPQYIFITASKVNIFAFCYTITYIDLFHTFSFFFLCLISVQFKKVLVVLIKFLIKKHNFLK